MFRPQNISLPSRRSPTQTNRFANGNSSANRQTEEIINRRGSREGLGWAARSPQPAHGPAPSRVDEVRGPGAGFRDVQPGWCGLHARPLLRQPPLALHDDGPARRQPWGTPELKPLRVRAGKSGDAGGSVRAQRTGYRRGQVDPTTAARSKSPATSTWSRPNLARVHCSMTLKSCA